MRTQYIVTFSSKAEYILDYRCLTDDSIPMGTIDEIKDKILGWNSDFNWIEQKDGSHEGYISQATPFYMVRVILQPWRGGSGVDRDRKLHFFCVVIKCDPEGHELTEAYVADFVKSKSWSMYREEYHRV